MHELCYGSLLGFKQGTKAEKGCVHKETLFVITCIIIIGFFVG